MFENREQAGKLLAKALKKYKNKENVLVIGLPRGGVVTAFEVAKGLHASLDVLCPRKIGAPSNPELAIGAITETGHCFLNEELIAHLHVPQAYIKQKSIQEQDTAKLRAATFRKNRPAPLFEGKIVIIVDDGLATGATMKAAVMSLKEQKAAKVVVAVPVSPQETAKAMKELCDEFICLDTPWFFQAVGQFYADFRQTEDAEVIELLSHVN